ncbi:MAG: murein tripeptide amidase MpaA [Candidatus Marinimicrobia bacterium]|nr:murein tripeptide amidase MpaA [Candidatus Neomarinimicrobiota bacterium]MCF7851336.1 murein tripeptide amidase MpaA [Candidatus Neomarinimicrobiota bacterium]MCF7904327.1 murein tripeptide amidase MpaA [Candidatus Neomarinimicrobiota bacterium]
MTEQNAESGTLDFKPRPFGNSVRGIPLEIYEPIGSKPSMLIISAIHGDENLGSVLISECLRSMQSQDLYAAVILSMNPDGILAGTRGNSNGVDLNRNYPTDNWKPDPVYYRNRPGEPQNIALSPGKRPGSEPETMALMELMHALKPYLVVSFHGFLACIDDPLSLDISKDIAGRTNMELVPDVGYKTPGSFGSWCAEQDIPIITYELPSLGIAELRKMHTPVIRDLLTGKYDSMLG